MSSNHALQRTGSAVTAPATLHLRLSAHPQVPRPLRLSLSLGSFGDSAMHFILRPFLLLLFLQSFALGQHYFSRQPPAGKRANIAADNSIVHDAEVLFATVRPELTKTIQQQGVRSFALACPVRCDRRDTGQSSDAVQVQLEHIDGTSVSCYLPYQISGGQPVPGEVFATHSTERLFP